MVAGRARIGFLQGCGPQEATCTPVDRATLSGHSGFKTTETQELRETGRPSGEGTGDEMVGGAGFQNITNAFIKFSNKNFPPSTSLSCHH